MLRSRDRGPVAARRPALRIEVLSRIGITRFLISFRHNAGYEDALPPLLPADAAKVRFGSKPAYQHVFYEVTRLMPAGQTGEVSYRIKSSDFGERAVRESEITAQAWTL